MARNKKHRSINHLTRPNVVRPAARLVANTKLIGGKHPSWTFWCPKDNFQVFATHLAAMNAARGCAQIHAEHWEQWAQDNRQLREQAPWKVRRDG